MKLLTALANKFTRQGKTGPPFSVEIGLAGPMPLQVHTASDRTGAYELALDLLGRYTDTTNVVLLIGKAQIIDGRPTMIARPLHNLGGPAKRVRSTVKSRMDNHIKRVAKAAAKDH